MSAAIRLRSSGERNAEGDALVVAGSRENARPGNLHLHLERVEPGLLPDPFGTEREDVDEARRGQKARELGPEVVRAPEDFAARRLGELEERVLGRTRLEARRLRVEFEARDVHRVEDAVGTPEYFADETEVLLQGRVAETLLPSTFHCSPLMIHSRSSSVSRDPVTSRLSNPSER
jgi:hypothetical protein